MGAHQSTVSRVIYRVTNALADLRHRYIKMPENTLQIENDFYKIARFPRVVGCIDGTHIKIQSPGMY